MYVKDWHLDYEEMLIRLQIQLKQDSTTQGNCIIKLVTLHNIYLVLNSYFPRTINE